VVSSDVAIHNAKEGIKGGKKRRMQHPQGPRLTSMMATMGRWPALA
jgi:hypothetical protein